MPEVGLFIAINGLVSILGYFSDIGFAASLIQKKEGVTLTDLRTTFTIQQILVVLILAITLILSHWIFSFYHIADSGTGLFYSLLAAFFFASLKTIPSAVLERQLRFDILAAVDIVESLVFYSLAVLLAWQGHGVASYTWAVFLRGVVGVCLIYYLAPWQIGFGISKSSVKKLLSFGVPYQFNSLMAVVKDQFLNLALWKIIGAYGVGIVGWAQTWSQKPLRIFMDNVITVTFPAYSRMQEHPGELKSAIEKTLFFVCLTTFPVVAGMASVMPVLFAVFPKYDVKWHLALLPLALYCLNSAWAVISTPLTNTLYALGKAKINTYLMLMWTALGWGLTPLLAWKFGYLGVAYATGLISFTSIIPILIVRRLVNFSLLKSVVKPALSTLALLTVSLILSRALPANIFTLLLNIGLSALVYTLTLYLLVGPSLITDFTKLAYAFRHKK